MYTPAFKAFSLCLDCEALAILAETIASGCFWDLWVPMPQSHPMVSTDAPHSLAIKNRISIEVDPPLLQGTGIRTFVGDFGFLQFPVAMEDLRVHQKMAHLPQ